MPAMIRIYLVLHIPDFILLLIGFKKRNTNPNTTKILFIITGLYFIIGAGICGGML